MSDRWPAKDGLIEYSQQPGQAGRPEAKLTRSLPWHRLALGLVPWEELRLPQSKSRESKSRMEARRPERAEFLQTEGEEPEHCLQRIEVERAMRERPVTKKRDKALCAALSFREDRSREGQIGSF